MISVTSGIQVLDRAVLVLDTLARQGPCSLADLQRETDLPRPTAYRLAIGLVRHGVLARDAEGRFVLGHRLAAWGAVAGRGLPDAGRPVLARLGATTGESAQLYVREGNQRVCVAVYERPSGLRDTVPLGAVLPLERGSGGKVLLAWAADAAEFAVDRTELAAVRKRGWAASVGEREAGVASVSAPVFDGTGSVVAAVSVSGPIDRLGQHPGRRLGGAVRGAAGDLTTALGGPGNPPHVTAG
ncbi:MAG TPA: IclR family transcriptional regulator [Acidimicrobiia bacterium]|nr:IclR family transcriptional regulator [Acidimicrobiia bacterium]